MASGKRLIAAGVAALVVGLVLTFPARIAYQWFAPEQFALSGISGSVWSGAATQGSASGLFLTDITWKFRPLSLFRLKAGYAVAAKLPSGFVETGVAIGTGNRIYLDDFAAAIPLSVLASLRPTIGGMSGDLSLQFSKLVFEGGMATEAEGTVAISGLVLEALSATALGDYRAQLQTRDGAIAGTFEDISGEMDVSGNLVLERDGAFSLVGTVAAGPNAPAAIHDELRYLGSPDNQGRREFRLEGTL